MQLEQLALLAETLGGVGVVASLLYLAFEVRKQGRLNRADAASKFAASWSDIMASMHDDPELSAFSATSSRYPVRRLGGKLVSIGIPMSSRT